MGWPWDRAPKEKPSIPRFEKPARDIAVPIDDTDCSLRALDWAVRNLWKPSDSIHLLSVVPEVPGPYPAEVLDADVPAACASSLKAWKSEQLAHASETEALLSLMQHHAVSLGVVQAQVHIHELRASGGAQGVGKAIANFINKGDADLVVVGSRGLQGWQRRLDQLLGGGSVSFYTLMHVHCPVVVIKEMPQGMG